MKLESYRLEKARAFYRAYDATVDTVEAVVVRLESVLIGNGRAGPMRRALGAALPAQQTLLSQWSKTRALRGRRSPNGMHLVFVLIKLRTLRGRRH